MKKRSPIFLIAVAIAAAVIVAEFLIPGIEWGHRALALSPLVVIALGWAWKLLRRPKYISINVKGNNDPLALINALREALGDEGVLINPNSEHARKTSSTQSDVEDARRFRWLIDGNGYFLEENTLCGRWAQGNEVEKARARRQIDLAMQEGQGD